MNKQTVIGIVVIVLIGGGLVWYFSGTQLNQTKSSTQPYFVNLYGPGEVPHAYSIDPARHQTIDDIARDPTDLPPPLTRTEPTNLVLNLEAKEVIAEIAPGISYFFITFDGKVPGPFLRGRVGDRITIRLKNPAINTTSIDLHAVTGPGGGGKVQVAPGETKSFTFKALIPGVFIYHGASSNIPGLMASGAFGLILIEPELGLDKVDREFYVAQGELYTPGPIGEQGFKSFDPERALREDPSYIVFNGRTGALVDHPLEANVGERIRIYFVNGGIAKTSSFHIIGEVFDKVYLEGSLISEPQLGVQTTIAHAGGATMVELGLEYPADYVLVDHNLIRIEKGAWGVLRVSGVENKEIFDRAAN